MNKEDIVKVVEDLLELPLTKQVLRLKSNTIERAYEAYIFSLCKKAVEQAGGTTQLMGIKSGLNPNLIIFRGAPGQMSSKLQDYCYCECDLNGKKFEIHLDVQYEGKSKAYHEIDVSIYDYKKAKSVRDNGTKRPKHNGLIMMFECKFYEKSTPGTDLARTFAGLALDCSHMQLKAFISNKSSKNLRNYFTNKNDLAPFTYIDSVDKHQENVLLSNLEQSFRKWAP